MLILESLWVQLVGCMSGGLGRGDTVADIKGAKVNMAQNCAPPKHSCGLLLSFLTTFRFLTFLQGRLQHYRLCSTGWGVLDAMQHCIGAHHLRVKLRGHPMQRPHLSKHLAVVRPSWLSFGKSLRPTGLQVRALTHGDASSHGAVKCVPCNFETTAHVHGLALDGNVAVQPVALHPFDDRHNLAGHPASPDPRDSSWSPAPSAVHASEHILHDYNSDTTTTTTNIDTNINNNHNIQAQAQGCANVRQVVAEVSAGDAGLDGHVLKRLLHALNIEADAETLELVLGVADVSVVSLEREHVHLLLGAYVQVHACMCVFCNCSGPPVFPLSARYCRLDPDINILPATTCRTEKQQR